MCGIDFVTSIQGLNLFWGPCSQGVALGCHVMVLSARSYCIGSGNMFKVL